MVRALGDLQAVLDLHTAFIVLCGGKNKACVFVIDKCAQEARKTRKKGTGREAAKREPASLREMLWMCMKIPEATRSTEDEHGIQLIFVVVAHPAAVLIVWKARRAGKPAPKPETCT